MLLQFPYLVFNSPVYGREGVQRTRQHLQLALDEVGVQALHHVVKISRSVLPLLEESKSCRSINKDIERLRQHDWAISTQKVVHNSITTSVSEHHWKTTHPLAAVAGLLYQPLAQLRLAPAFGRCSEQRQDLQGTGH